MMTAADAQKIMAAAKNEAAKNKWPVSIAVVDDSGALLLFERLDGASASSASTAVGKAQAAAGLRVPTKMLGDLLSAMPGAVKLPGLFLQGAVPVMYQGECVGAVGASGVQAHEDEQVAAAGAATIA
jgi:glc operon protein GlcG